MRLRFDEKLIGKFFAAFLAQEQDKIGLEGSAIGEVVNGEMTFVAKEINAFVIFLEFFHVPVEHTHEGFFFARSVDGVEGKPVSGRDKMLELRIVLAAFIVCRKFEKFIGEYFVDGFDVEIASGWGRLSVWRV